MKHLKSARPAVLGTLLALACGLFAWRYDLIIVVGRSMEPAFSTGDLLLVDTRAYVQTDPARGDIVVARHGRDLIVKRVVGLPREEVEMKAGRLMVNGHPEPEPYPVQGESLWIARGKLSEGRYALAGDNRKLSVEEAVHGVVGKSELLGRASRVFGFGRTLPRPGAENIAGADGPEGPAENRACILFEPDDRSL